MNNRKQVRAILYLLRLRSTWTTRLQFALGALEDEPMRARVAHVAVPEDEGGVGLDHFEAVLALARLRHLGRC